ncbi:MAG: hypothetical protein WC848_06545 [Parcubacteria group bacterium]|jgi:hypothetical protein
MDVLLENFSSGLIALAKAFSTSMTFAAIKLFLEVYVIVMFVDLVLMLKQRGLGADIRDTLVGMNIPSEFGNRKNKLRAKWAKVRVRLESKNESEYKVAIIEADNIIDNLVARMNYKGTNLTERLDSITPGQIENIEDLRKAHEIRNRIIHDETFVLTKAEAEKIFGYYEDFLRFFMVLD